MGTLGWLLLQPTSREGNQADTFRLSIGRGQAAAIFQDKPPVAIAYLQLHEQLSMSAEGAQLELTKLSPQCPASAAVSGVLTFGSMAKICYFGHPQRGAKRTYMLVGPGLNTDAHTFAIC